MKLPVTFEQFSKNPVAAVAFCMLLVVGYLYVDLRSGYTDQIEKSNKKIDALEVKIDKMAYALKKSDSALSAAITELRIINTLKKI
jgi:archaellum component FlaF (FlaF/FlaG flagellin family)